MCIRDSVLIAAQYKMPKELLKVQNMLFHLMPNSAFNKMGFKKADAVSYTHLDVYKRQH